MSMTRRSLLAALLVLMTISISEGGEMREDNNESAKTEAAAALDSVLKNVAGKRIYFGHQSVGFNILEGISDIVKDHPGSGLNLVKTNDPLAFKVPVFAHFTVGENEDPSSKIDDFARSMDKGIGGNAEIAFFKFCYVDVNRTTNTDKIFAAYKNTMERLKNKYPQTRFVHVTAPLTVSKFSVRSLIKKVLGTEDNNIRKNTFNEMIVREYKSKDPIFDLAAIESTYPDGSRSVFTVGGKTYYSLAPEYTEDDGHLNEKGRMIMAAELLKFLSQIDTVTK